MAGQRTKHPNREEKPMLKILLIVLAVVVVIAVLGKLRSR